MAAETLSAEDKDALKKLELAMRLADRLNPQITNADKIIATLIRSLAMLNISYSKD